MKILSFSSSYKSVILFLYVFLILVVNIGIFGQNCINPNSSLKKSQNTIVVGYYPAYKYNSTPDFNIINPSVTHINYIAFSLTDLTNNIRPYTVFNLAQVDKFRQFKNRIQNLGDVKIILSVLLPINDDLIKIPAFSNVTNGYNSSNPGNQQFINDLVSIVKDYSFDGIDIDYPYKIPCYQYTQFDINGLNSVFTQFLADISNKLKQSTSNKILTITAGQYNISNINLDIITFVNIQAFRLNINTTRPSAGISDIQGIINSWSGYFDNSKLVLGIELGGIIEAITSNNLNTSPDIPNQNFAILRSQNITFQFPSLIDENIIDPCKITSYAHLQWKILTSLLVPPCYSNPNQGSNSGWNYGFDNYQSLNAKFDLIKKSNLAGIAISDITKDYSQLMGYISGNSNFTPTINTTHHPTSTSTPLPGQPNPSNTGAIVGGVIGSFIFVGAITAAGFMFYRKHRAKMSDLLKDTKNQTCSDINRQDYSDINRQVRPDTHNRIYSDTNHQAS
ncbi:glycoside hydrolase superfamily [Gigaspora rosea]|uniref:Glycoside hydrolase superfamily n=1 Tax=Gigaspora rosea TaxID=44941 RepID=A0A397TYP8_9GLOM|nr:glycoside hydrolase superfamily [Gigaspora rosea]